MTDFSNLLARAQKADPEELAEMAREYILTDPHYAGNTEHDQMQIQPEVTPAYMKSSRSMEGGLSQQTTKKARRTIPRSQSQESQVNGYLPP